MQCDQLKHPSDHLYQIVKITDPVEVMSKHYAIAVDIHDYRTRDIFMSLLDTLSRNDSVTFIAFGEHSDVEMFQMNDPPHERISQMLSRRETGLCTLVGFRELEHVDADVHGC